MIKFTHKLTLCLLLATSLPLHAGYQTIQKHLLPNLSAHRTKDELSSEFSRHKAALNILHAAAVEQNMPVLPTLSDTTISDLNILFYDPSKPDFTVLNKVKRTLTTVGTCELGRILITPLTDQKQLSNRQNLIKLLANNDELRTSIKNIVQTFAPHEEQLLALWNPEDRLYGKNMRLSFFNGQIEGRKPKNNFVFELKSRYDDGLQVFSTVLGFLALDYIDRLVKMHSGDKTNPATVAKFVLPALGMTISVPNAINNYKNRRDLVKMARTRLRSLVALSSAARSLEQWAKEHRDYAAVIPALNMVTHFTDTKNDRIHRFLNVLASPSFDIKNHYFSSRIAPVLNAIPTFLMLKGKLCPILQAIAHMDALVSIAELYKEHQSTPLGYCFTQYKNNENGPFLHARKLWHPVLDPAIAVPNDTFLGGQGHTRNMVVTGANAGGKSTISKAITLGALFAQTLTIAPAAQLTLTPFTVLNTYLNIVDDFSSGMSQHRAEVRRAIELINSITQLKPDQYALTIMDEMFRCTNPNTGAGAALGIGKVLGTLPNSLLVMATHFACLTDLARQPASSFANYRVGATKKEDGSFKFHYRLEPGINEKVIALDLLASEGFDQLILDYANTHLDRVQQLERITNPNESFVHALKTQLEREQKPR